MEILKLKKEITFEGTRYTELDLSGLEELSGEEYGSLCKQAENLDGVDMIPEKASPLLIWQPPRSPDCPMTFSKAGRKRHLPTEICRQQFFSRRGLSGISESLLKSLPSAFLSFCTLISSDCGEICRCGS